MKKVAIALVVLLVLGAVLLAGLNSWGIQLLGYKLVWRKEAAELEQLAKDFLADLKYKDFAKASKYHNYVDQQKADIPALIERLFAIKPEQLNLRDYKITSVDLDEGGKRARTHFRATYVALNTARGEDKEKKDEEREIEGILYWHKLPASEGRPPVIPIPTPGDAPLPATGIPVTAQGDPPAEGEPEQWFMKLESSLH